MSAKSGKRPLRSLSAHEKLDAIRRVHDGESKASVARDIGVPESTLRGWCKNEDKISYLSRQSSPETDESIESQIKKTKLDEISSQPYNLSLKSSATIFSDSKTDDIKLNEPIKIPIKESPKTSSFNERERNRAELARLSVELGLNRPEMFVPSLNSSASNLADITTNINLLAQWNALLMQQQHHQQQKLQQQLPKKVPAQMDTTGIASAHVGLLTTVDQETNKFTVKDKPSVHESVWYWLKSQQSMLGMSHTPTTISNSVSNLTNVNNTTPSTTVSWPNMTPAVPSVSPDQNATLQHWYKQIAYQQQPHSQECKPILYQQLTKDAHPKPSISPLNVTLEPVIDQQNAENLSLHDDKQKQMEKISNSKIRSVLDNLLFNNNNNVSVSDKDGKGDEMLLSQSEAVEHGEKFLKWMEACSDPSVTAMQIMQFRTLLNNIKTGADKKNGDLQNKTKGKRK